MGNTKRSRNQRRSHGAGKASRFNRLESLNELAIVLFLFLEPTLNMLASLGELGRDRFDSFKHWIQRFWEQPGGKLVPRRVRSRDLKSVRFLKQGFSGYIYETTWSTWYGMERSGRYARKDFPGVDCEVFEAEAARLVNLDHPNVVKTYCWTVDRLGCSLVMEFVSDDLESVVRRRKALRTKAAEDPKMRSVDIVAANSPFELVEAMYIMWHIAAAMEYLHSMQVAHGDLRPNNVLVDLDPGRMIVKVVDFGLIDSKKGTTLVSKRAKFLQILEWKAPEMCKELVDFLNVTSDQYPWTSCTEHSDDFQKLRMADIYSFAILCTYIMGGKVSYPKSSLKELQKKLLSGTLKPKLPSTCPRRLKKLIGSCWSRIAPEKRTGFHEFRKQLEGIIRQETTTGRLEVGGIMQRWVETIQQMGLKNTLYYTYTATLHVAGMYFSISKSILVDTLPPVENAKLSISKSAEPPPSPSTKLLPRPSLEPASARLPAELALSESLDSPSAMLNTEPLPSDSHLAGLDSHLAGLKAEPTLIETSHDSPDARVHTEAILGESPHAISDRLSTELVQCESFEPADLRSNSKAAPNESLEQRLNSEPAPTCESPKPVERLNTEPLAPGEGHDSTSMRLNIVEPTLSESFDVPARRPSMEPALGESPDSPSARLNVEPALTQLVSSLEPSTWSDMVSGALATYHTRVIGSEIEATKEHWSELVDPVEYEEEIRKGNLETFASLKETYGEFFVDNMDNIQVVQKLAGGGQSNIFVARWLDREGEFALKVFSREQESLEHLQKRFPMDFLLKEAHAQKQRKSVNPRLCHIFGGLLMDDGRFAFAMEKYWGDLRKMIDIRMEYNGKRLPPFTTAVAKRIILEISEGMQRLHEHDVLHRDVKAANIFIKPLDTIFKFHPEDDDAFSCLVGDFECSVGVIGTGFWRAPEILSSLRNRKLSALDITEKSDVYSFSMTCYEILTGSIPFEDLTARDYDVVLRGFRPTLPPDVHPTMESLLARCWHQEPSIRPTFVEIVKELENMISIEEGESSKNI